MNRETEHIRLGEILKEASLLSSELICEAIDRFEAQGLPLGKVLIASGYLSESQIKIALDLQYMINDGLLPLESAIEVLKTAYENNNDLEFAFVKLGVKQPPGSEVNKIGQILIAAGALDETHLEESLVTSKATTLPIGHLICQRSYVSQPILQRALLIQQLIRRSQLDRNTGIESLRKAVERESSLCQLACNKGFTRRPLRQTPLMGDLLTISAVCPERRVKEALTSSIKKGIPLGEELLATRSVTADVVDAAVCLQEMLDNNTIELEQAKKSLEEVRLRRILLVKAIGEITTFKLKTNQSPALMEMLENAGLFSQDRLPAILKDRLSVKYNQIAQVVKGLEDRIDIHSIYSALRAVDLLNRNILDRENIIEALKFSDSNNVSIDEALIAMNFLARTRLRNR